MIDKTFVGSLRVASNPFARFMCSHCFAVMQPLHLSASQRASSNSTCDHHHLSYLVSLTDQTKRVLVIAVHVVNKRRIGPQRLRVQRACATLRCFRLARLELGRTGTELGKRSMMRRKLSSARSA